MSVEKKEKKIFIFKKSIFHHENKIMRKCIENGDTLNLPLFDNENINDIKVIKEELDHFVLEFFCSPEQQMKIVENEDDTSKITRIKLPHDFIKRTKYDGIVYRSKLEAQTAYFMTLLEVKFFYEPLTFNLPNSRYIPDFWLPDQNVFIEIKPRFPYVEEIEKCEFVAKLGFHIILMYGTVSPPHCIQTSEKDYVHENGCRGMAWGPGNVRFSGEFVWVERDGKFIIDSYDEIRECNWNHEKILEAYNLVSQYSF